MRRILSIDGGGIKGVVPAAFLAQLEETLGESITHFFDLIAGTSTGGILAVGLAHTTDGKNPTYSAQQLLGLYQDHGAEIFKRAWYEPAALLKCTSRKLSRSAANTCANGTGSTAWG